MFFAETLVTRDPRCHVVTDESELDYWEKLLCSCGDAGLISWDTETSGFDWWGKSTRYRQGPALPIGHCFGFDRGNGPEGVYLPIRHLTTDRNLDTSKVSALVQEVLGDQHRQVVTQNGKFDLHMAEADGISVRALIHDTMICAALIDENTPKDLETLVEIYRVGTNAKAAKGRVLSVFRDECKRRGCRQKDAPGYAWIPSAVLGPYGALDGIHTLALGHKLLPWIQGGWWDLYCTELRLLRILQGVEHRGSPIDVPYLLDLHERFTAKKERIESQIHELAGYQFNPGSDDRVRELVYGRLKQPVNYTTKSSGWDEAGTPSVDATALMDVIHRTSSPVVRSILDWREVAKIVSTYTVSIVDQCDADGMLHGSFDQVGTNTGRLSSKKPNLQNLPSKDSAGIRRAWLVPRGKVRLYMDFSQVELRVLAHCAREPSMTQAFINGEDVHSATSLRMFGNALKVNRRIAKVINFGVAYGMSKYGVRDNLNKQADPSRGIRLVDDAKAGDYLDQWHGLYPRVAAHVVELVNGMKRVRPCAFTNIFGRTRRIPHVSALGSVGRRGARQAIASEIQGTAAELTKISMVRAQAILDEGRQRGDFDGEIVGTIHDEVIIDVERGGSLRCATLVKAAMEDFPQFLPIPIIADGEWSSTTWADKTNIWPEGA